MSDTSYLLNKSVELGDRVSELENIVNKQNVYFDYIQTEVSNMKDIIVDKKFIAEYLDKIDIKDLEQYIRKRKIININET